MLRFYMEQKTIKKESSKIPNLILLVAIMLGAYRFFRPDMSWVHPHYYYDILPQSLANGSQIKFRDLIDIFQPRQDFEVRSRFLNYLILSWDQKIRIFIHGNFFIPSNFLPIITSLNILSCFMFYKIVLNLFEKKNLAKIGTAIYIVSIGFYSLIGNVYMAAKPVSSFLVIYSMLVATEYIKDKISSKKFILINSILICLGLFTDEIMLIVIINYLFLFFTFYLKRQNYTPTIDHKIPPKVKKALGIRKPDTNYDFQVFKKIRVIFASFFASIAIWAMAITFLVPMLTKKYFGWDFPFWQFNLNLKNDINFGGGYPEGTQTNLLFIMKSGLDNFFNILTYQFLPIGLFRTGESPDLAYGQPNSLYRYGNPNMAGWLLVAIVILYLLYLLLYKRKKDLLYSFGILTLSILFFSVLQIKHVPKISGYVYGAAISIYFTLFIVILIDKLSSKKDNNFGVYLLTLIIIFTQFVNGNEFNSRWDIFHRSWSSTAISNINALPSSDLARGIKTSIEINPKMFEDFNIWYHYKNNSLETYLINREISLKGATLVLELRLGDYSKDLNDGKYHCNIGGLELACIGYRAK